MMQLDYLALFLIIAVFSCLIVWLKGDKSIISYTGYIEFKAMSQYWIDLRGLEN